MASARVEYDAAKAAGDKAATQRALASARTLERDFIAISKASDATNSIWRCIDPEHCGTILKGVYTGIVACLATVVSGAAQKVGIGVDLGSIIADSINRVVAPTIRRQVSRMLKSDFVRELEAELDIDADGARTSAWVDSLTKVACNLVGVFAAFKCEGLLLIYSSCLVGADLIVRKITQAAERALPRAADGEAIEQAYGKALTTVQYACAGAGFYWQTLGGGGKLPGLLYPVIAVPLLGERALASVAISARASRV